MVWDHNNRDHGSGRAASLGYRTCCIGFLPYLNAVITLPLLVFDLAYPVYFLEQFGPQYKVMQEPILRAFPVIMPRPAGPAPMGGQ